VRLLVLEIHSASKEKPGFNGCLLIRAKGHTIKTRMRFSLPGYDNRIIASFGGEEYIEELGKE
jgi:hypothetical protein